MMLRGSPAPGQLEAAFPYRVEAGRRVPRHPGFLNDPDNIFKGLERLDDAIES